MKNRVLKLAVILSIASVCVCPGFAADSNDDFASSSFGQELISLGMKFLENPGDFFFNLHSDNEDFSPVPKERNGAIRHNFFPSMFPLTWMNLNVKVKIFNEKGNMPQIDMVGLYGDLIALRAAASSMDDVKPTFNDYAIGAVVSRGMNEKTRIFGGLKYSTVNMSVKFSSSSAIEFGDFRVDELNFKVADTFFYSGITQKTGEKSCVLAQLGYGFKYKKIVSRLMISHKHLELGMDIFPEGLFVIHPFMAWHWYF